MKIDLSSSNTALTSIFRNPDQVITLDANSLIPPHRTRYAKRGFNFPLFKKVWLDPFYSAFPRLAIHEAVYDELIMPSVQSFVQSMINCHPPRLVIHKDSDLTPEEKVLRDTIESRIYPLTSYDPMLDNKDDRGEVKSLTYVAAKGLLYFAAHDYNAIQLIEKAEQWSTGLDNVQAVKMYEVIFYLYKTDIGDKESLRMLYKYQYYLTLNERKNNPKWGQFIEKMDALYPSDIIK